MVSNLGHYFGDVAAREGYWGNGPHATMGRVRNLRPGPATIHCCICLNRGVMTAATTLIKGYAVCGDHVKMVSAAGFDISRISTNPAKRMA